MPRYVASCKKCDLIFDYFASIDNRNNPVTCKCGYIANRDVAAELACMSNFNATMRSNPRWSNAMGVPASQVNDFRERFPNSTYSNDGRLLVKNRVDKLRQMKERGFIEHR